MPFPTNKSDSDEIEEYDQDIEELLSIEHDLSDKLKDILKKVVGSEESDYQLNTYLFLLNNLSKDLRIKWIFVGNHIVRHLGKLEYTHQNEILDYILSKIDIFSNKQLAMFYTTLTKIMRISELKAKYDKSTPHFKKIKTFRHHILHEMLLKSRYKENSIDEIILKYIENPHEAIQQLVNKNQFLKDFKVIVNNLDKFTKEQLEEYFNFIKNGILKYLINLYSTPEIKYLYSTIEEIPQNIKIKKKKNLLKYIATKGDPFYELKTEEKRVKELKLCLRCKKNEIAEKHRPLCKSCFEEKIFGFPDKYFTEEHAFKNLYIF